MTPQFQSNQDTLSNLHGIVDALCALEDNGLKNDHSLSVPLCSTDPVKFYRQGSHKSLPKFPGRCVIALGRNTYKFFLTSLDTYCLTLFLHPSGLLYFGAPNPGRRHIACSRCQGVRRLGGLPFMLEGQHCWHQRVGVAEVQQRPPECLPGVSAAEMAGC